MVTGPLTSGVTMICARLISRCHWKSQFGSSFLLPQGNHPASVDLKPSVPVEAFLSRGHVDVEGLLKWQFSRVSGRVHHCGLFPSDEVMVLPGIFSYC